MTDKDSAIQSQREAIGLGLGFLAILSFSLTLPATKAAVGVFGGWTIGIGRAVVAGVLAALLLAVTRTQRPTPKQAKSLAIIALGVVFGFPVFTALALEHVPATRGAIVIGVLPSTTALVATVRHGERPSVRFWLAAVGGLVTVVLFAILSGSRGRPEPADLLLALAVLAAAIGYAEGAEVTRTLGSWQTICFALVLSLPITVPGTAVALAQHGITEPTVRAYLGFAYVSLVSMFFGFFAWYTALSLGGVARVSQVQLLQPVLTLGWAWLLLSEPVGVGALIAAFAVAGFVWLSRRAAISSPKTSNAMPDQRTSFH